VTSDASKRGEARHSDEQRRNAGARRTQRRDGAGPLHEEIVADGVQRQHRQRHLQEDLGLLGSGQNGAVEHHAEHGDERQRHGARVALTLLEQARLKTK
jgi:hypothetical protein